ncbi:MAG: DUF6612 family protein, partial [Dehalococcoidia bacterium]
WIKTRLTEDLWQDQNPVASQMELMEDFLKANYLGMESIGGFNCYKIDVEPNWEALLRATEMEDMDYYDTDELLDMIKDTKCVVWVAEGSYFPMQIFFSMIMEMDFFGQKFSVAVDMTMTFSNINEPVTITLPEAALSATEISYEDFMYGDW